jgi:DNA repair protein RecO (recombination protein O)
MKKALGYFMNWEDTGIVLKYRTYSEKQLIASVFTQQRGRVDGMITRTKSSMPQPGDFVAVYQKARLEQHLGTLKLETKQSHSSLQFCDATRVYALQTMLEILGALLPENHPYPNLWEHVNNTIQLFYQPTEAIKAYCLFEVLLIEELGFGLSLDVCAVLGTKENLTHVSPKTGCAVCYGAALPYINRLLALPEFLINKNCEPKPLDFVNSLLLTGHFLVHYASHNKPLPLARQELLQKLRIF